MPINLHSPRTIAGIAINGSLTLGALAVAIFVAQPWALATAGVLSLCAMRAAGKSSKLVFENDLVPHADNHRRAPRLGQTITELCAASGLTDRNFRIYDIAVKYDAYKEKGFGANAVRNMIDSIQYVPNALSFNLGKPVIAISKPLLEILDDEEEKAVLAHEFAHAAASHQRIAGLQRALTSVAKLSTALTLAGTLIASGLGSFATYLGTCIATAASLYTFHPRKPLFSKDIQGDLSPLEKREKTQIIKSINLASDFTGLAVASYVAPGFVPVWLTAKGIGLSAAFASATLSRSMEYQADKGAAALGGNPLALITSLRKVDFLMRHSILEVFNEEIPPARGWFSRERKNLFASHPLMERRFARLADIARRQGYDEREIKTALHGDLKAPAGTRISYGALREMAHML